MDWLRQWFPGKAGMLLLLLPVISAGAIVLFLLEIQVALEAAGAISLLIKPSMALGILLLSWPAVMKYQFVLPVEGPLPRYLGLSGRGFLLLMVSFNSIAILLSADKPSSLFLMSAWAALACLVGYILVAVAVIAVSSSQGM